MSTGRQMVTARDLIDEAKKRIVFLSMCVIGLSYLMSWFISERIENVVQNSARKPEKVSAYSKAPVAWSGKLNAIACASKSCARIPSSNENPLFWIPIHIVIPERPTESTVFNVIAATSFVKDASCWQREHEWRQDIAIISKWLSGGV
ncbi:hypothetical protein Lser_V15G06491 [Lactuca serriola]